MTTVDNPRLPGFESLTMGPLPKHFSTMRTDLWQRGCERLASELPEQQFNTWIRPLPPGELTEDGSTGAVVTLRVPNRFKLDWIRNQYSGRIEAVLSDLAGKPVRLDVTLSAREGASAVASNGAHAPRAAGVRAGLPDLAVNGNRAPAAAVESSSYRATSTNAPGAFPQPSRSRLNPLLSFDTLVPGRANQMARTAALHVAGAPGQMYNPLFVYGGVGLGKTHLVHAVGNALLKDKPDARVLYLHAEQFITDVVKNYQRKTFDELKAKYHQLDLLLIDDVQFFAGKERTQ